MESGRGTPLAIQIVRHPDTGRFVDVFGVYTIYEFLFWPRRPTSYRADGTILQKGDKTLLSIEELTVACQWLATQGHLRKVMAEPRWYALPEDSDAPGVHKADA
ncbi:MAG TPA: hypothetical protein VFC19_15250 [Candidatus Limnocylindrales bacterium]|nr:hypothetical protein [Candidatus Limnocylindrales bacterium]